MRTTFFVNRDKELKFLRDYYNDFSKNGFIPIYGRRRIGKTSLVKKSVENYTFFYFLSKKTSIKDNIENLMNKFKEDFNLNYLLNFSNFRDFFYYLKSLNKRIIVIVDEFPYLTSLDKSISSEFQYIVDEILINSKIKLILLGSSVSMILKDVLSYSSSLYGRRLGNINLGPLDFKYLKEFFRKSKLDIEDLIKVYGIVGGIPYYLEILKDKNYNEIIKTIFSKNNIFYEEIDFILKEELKDPRLYKLILKAIARGSNKFTEIVNVSGIDKVKVNYYLEILEELKLIKKEKPYLSSYKTKKTSYRIIDEFTNFWFRFIEKYRDYIEFEDFSFLDNFEKEYNEYLSFVFEKIAKEFLFLKEKKIYFRQWGSYLGKDRRNKSYEIDLLNVDNENKIISAFEVKWKNLTERELIQILEDLSKKINYLNLNVEDYTINLGVVCKKIENKNIYQNVYDLKDFNEVFFKNE
jgi:hypothetical protein